MEFYLSAPVKTMNVKLFATQMVSFYVLFLTFRENSYLSPVVRAQEERTLRQELPGYEAYLAQVKYRFIPYIW
jgi:protein-S-isoprenylcysteine O-methyltransferase Ste14